MREFEEVMVSSTGIKEVCVMYRFWPVILGIDVYIEGGYTECYKVER